MCWNIAGASWILILEPCPTHVMVLLIDHEVDVFKLVLILVSSGNASYSSTNANEPKFSSLVNRFMDHCVGALPLTNRIAICSDALCSHGKRKSNDDASFGEC